MLPTTEQWQHFLDFTGEIYDLIAINYKLFPERDETAMIKDIITKKHYNPPTEWNFWNQENKQQDTIRTLAQQHLIYTRERVWLTLFYSQQLKQQLKVYQDKQEKPDDENRK